MDVRPGYKQTEVGVIPENWDVKTFAQLFAFRNGVNADKRSYGRGIRFINVLEPITYSHLYGPEIPGRVTLPDPIAASFAVRRGDVLFNRTSETQDEVGLAATYLGADPVVFGGFVIRGRPTDQCLDPTYSGYALRAPFIRSQIVPMGQGAIRANIGQRNLGLVVAPVPPYAEQCSIAGALSDADALIESLEQLLAKKRQIRQGAMHELLTGRTRLPGFTGTWTVKRIAEIAFPSSEKNVARQGLPVLTCSKHRGFVDSLAYFKSQVFSRDTSGYKVIKRGQIGYPSNHVEEGSIGLQDLYDVALVSPIYVVFSVTHEVDSYFLQRLLKLDSYRQAFATATSSSVDRRGSLRWPAFSQITVSLPRLDEQTVVVGTLRDMEAETAGLEAKLANAHQLKQGMMQELLTGRIRLI